MTSLTARRCIVCDAEATKRCSSCAREGIDLFFCSLEHFAEVWSGHKPYCGKDSSFLSQPLEQEIAVARALCGVPLQTTVVKHLVQVVWGASKADYQSLDGLRLRQSMKAIWGFDPVQTELGASDVDDEGSFPCELEKLQVSLRRVSSTTSKHSVRTSLTLSRSETFSSPASGPSNLALHRFQLSGAPSATFASSKASCSSLPQPNGSKPGTRLANRLLTRRTSSGGSC
ncbi:RHTO0S21e01222g1_1 [Rhodotorula toruloides]|uniref:RHTO0S21e01222g1_1 n=1 Tax=Rhodotorula toruloides TaxID=5286 RepID=A0A061BP96_RHOTO|nr:RHTO0S21e01222g1_1 [Rhodotorula toruloides]